MKCVLKTFLILAGTFNNFAITASINAVVNFDLIGEGFHRTLLYKINFEDLNQSNCAVALHVLLPPAIYVNVDEIAELKRLEKGVACSVGEIDVELFAEKARSQNVTICEEDVESSVSVTLSLPVHQRYRYSQKDGGYLAVEIPRPKLLLGCKNRLKDHRVSKIDLCSPCVDAARKWREIPYVMESADKVWRIPVGNASHLNQVSYVTLLVTSLGAAAVLKALFKLKTRDETGVKKD